MRKLLSALMLPLFLLPPVAASAQEREWIPYKKLVETIKLDKFYALPAAERDKLIMFANLKPVNKAISPANVKLTVVHSGGRQPIPLDARGRALIVPNRAFLAEDAKIWTSLPQGEKMSLSFEANAVLPEGLQWNYASVMGAVPQANAAMGKLAGMFSLVMPKMKTVLFSFDKPAQVTIHAKGGDKRYATDAKNQIRLKSDDALLAENPRVDLSQQPLEAELDTE
ncbi:MAG: hypothetical protein ACJ8LG_00765 [Massilia sp.]